MQLENVQFPPNEDNFSAKTILTYLPFSYYSSVPHITCCNAPYELVQDNCKNNQTNTGAINNHAEAAEAFLSSPMIILDQYLITYGIVVEKISSTSNEASSSIYFVLTSEWEHDCKTKLRLRKGRLMDLKNIYSCENLRGQVVFCEIKNPQNSYNNWRENEEIQLFTTSSFLHLLSLCRKNINPTNDNNAAMIHLNQELINNNIQPIKEINFHSNNEKNRFELHIKDTISFQLTSNFWYLTKKEKVQRLDMIIKEFLNERSKISEYVKSSPLSRRCLSISDNIEDNIFYSMFLYNERDQQNLIEEWLNPPPITYQNMKRNCLRCEEDSQEIGNRKIFYEKLTEEFSLWLSEDIVSDRKYLFLNKGKFLRSKSDHNQTNPTKYGDADTISKGYYHGIKSSPNFFQIIQNLLNMEILKADFDQNKEIMDLIGIQIIKEFLKRVLPEKVASTLL